MGCISSKILTRSGSFQELRQSFQRRSNGLEEILNAKNNSDQFLALVYTTNTLAQKLKAGPPALEPGTSKEVSSEHSNSKTIETEEQDKHTNALVDSTDIEIINTWELLDDIEDKEEDEEELEGQQKQNEEDICIINIDLKPSTSFELIKDKCENGHLSARSFRTVEEYDAMVAANYLLGHGKDANESSYSARECRINSEQLKRQERNGEEECSELPQSSKENMNSMIESVDTATSVEGSVTSTINLKSRKGLKRRAMAKELSNLEVPAFEFSRSGSLREWLNQGGQTFSPGSYVTPKFGNFISSSPNNGDKVGEDAIFDPELVANLEQDMEQLTMEEEHILQQILTSLDEGNGEDSSRMEKA